MNAETPESSLYIKNTAAFKERFPELYGVLEPLLFPEGTIPSPWQEDMLQKARNGSWTASFNGNLLHSSYNPEREAQKLISSASEKDFSAGVFFGAGLGYGPISFAAQHPNRYMIIIEPEISRLISAFFCTDWASVFSHASFILLAGASHPQIIALLEQIGLEDCHLFRTPALELHQQKFFNDLSLLIDRNIQKRQINNRTLKVFSRLWFRNMCRNLDQMALCTGITAFEDGAADIPALIIAAGPSLDDVLPFLSELKKKYLLICVDTALRACLRQGVQPHFVVLADPQYWNARHIEGLSAPESILITETAAYPSVFRFDCRSIHLCSSFFPLGQYVEKQTGSNGKLGTGGSVASTAWDFARYCGCRRIFTAGLDLGFPQGKTHTRGSTFEEKAHLTAGRMNTAETFITSALFSAKPVSAFSYDGTPLLTDNRMALYAWWFESRNAEYPDVRTCSITPRSLRIPGTDVSTVEKALEEPDHSAETASFIQNAETRSEQIPIKQRKEKLNSVIELLKNDLSDMEDTAEKALSLCRTRCLSERDYNRIARSLATLDARLRTSRTAELSSLLIPGRDELEQVQESIRKEEPVPYIQSLRFSGYVYSRILSSIQEWKKNLLK